MTLKELIELNKYITDIVICVKKDGLQTSEYHIGPDFGDEYWHIGLVYPGATLDPALAFDPVYIETNINSWDDGESHWQVIPSRLPADLLNLKVISWNNRSVSFLSHSRYKTNSSQAYEGIEVTVAPAECQADDLRKTVKVNDSDQVEGQMSLFD